MSSIATANSGGIVVKVAQCIRDNKEFFPPVSRMAVQLMLSSVLCKK